MPRATLRAALTLTFTLVAFSTALASPSPHAASQQPRAAASASARKPAAPRKLSLRSAAALVVDQASGKPLYEKEADKPRPIASVTKLMTAMVILDSRLPLDQVIEVTRDDIDTIKGSRSMLRVGTRLSRRVLLRLALMASENRAAFALARTYPGGTRAFVAAMNRKAEAIGMRGAHFGDPTGLDSANVATAHDLVRMVDAAYRYRLIREFTTTPQYTVTVGGHRLTFRNTDPLVKSPYWKVGLSKTGYINEAGHCLVMQARVASRNVVIVLLDSWGRLTRIGDANRVRHWLETVPRSFDADS
jgi:serine-type D-Ala-D-Ala endopeptidase (penicillin-binding protein 7)